MVLSSSSLQVVTSWLDGNHIVFGNFQIYVSSDFSLLGEVIEGYEAVELIESYGTSTMATRQQITIARSGLANETTPSLYYS